MNEGNGRYNLRPRRDLAAERRAQAEQDHEAIVQRENERRARAVVARRRARQDQAHQDRADGLALRDEQIARSRRFRAGLPVGEPPAQRRRIEEVVNVSDDESDDGSGNESDDDAQYNSDGERINEDGQHIDSDGEVIEDNGPDEWDVYHQQDDYDSYDDYPVDDYFGFNDILNLFLGRVGRFAGGRGRHRHRGSSDFITPRIDTLPYPTRPSKTIDLTDANMPASGQFVRTALAIKFLPFADTLVDSLPGRPEKSYSIFLSSYCKDSWQGLELKETQVSLAARSCRVYCSPVTAEMLKFHYPALYIELIPNLLTILEPDRCHVLTLVDGDKNLIVHPISVPDVFPGYTMYLFMYGNKTYIHTGVHAHIEDTKRVLWQVKDLVTKVDSVYIDTALYYPEEPGWDQTLKKELTARSDSISKVSVWVQSKLMVVPLYNDSFYHSDDEEENENFISVRFRTGMEMFIVRLVEKIHNWQDDIRFCFTQDVYELCFAELLKVLPLPHNDHVKVVDLLYDRNLSKSTADVFFYTEESADYSDLHAGNEHHCHLRVVYDMHSCMKLINRQFCSVMYTKDMQRGLYDVLNADDREKNQYIALYPSHPTKKQVDELITGLQPSEVHALGSASGVGVRQLTDHFTNMTKGNARKNNIATTSRSG